MFRKAPRLVIAGKPHGKVEGGRSGRHMRGHCWLGKGQAQVKDLFTTACQSAAWRRMPGKEPRLSESRDGLRGTRIGQTHIDKSGTIIGRVRLDQFALQRVKRTTTQPERSLVKCSQRGRTASATVGA
jgi:hypothetical protein